MTYFLLQLAQSLKKSKNAQKQDRRVTGSDVIDSSLQEIFGYIIRDYVQPWYGLISNDSDFLESGVRKSAQTLAINISNRYLYKVLCFQRTKLSCIIVSVPKFIVNVINY